MSSEFHDSHWKKKYVHKTFRRHEHAKTKTGFHTIHISHFDIPVSILHPRYTVRKFNVKKVSWQKQLPQVFY